MDRLGSVSMRVVVLILALFFLYACASSPPHVVARGGTIRAGTSGDYAPLSVWPSAQERPSGIAPSIFEAFAAQRHAEVSWTRFKWTELAADMQRGRFDVAADGITVRAERSIYGRFSVPIARGGAVLLLRRPRWAAGLDVQGLDRPELRIVVNEGGHLERVARATFRQANIVALPDNLGVREAFARHRADAAMTNTFEAPKWSEGLGGVERIGPLTHDMTAFWVQTEHAELAEALDTWLLSEDGTRRLVAAFGPDASTGPVSALLGATAERLALMPFVAAAKEKLGMDIEDPTQEARVLAAAEAAVEKAAQAHRTPPPSKALVDAFFQAQLAAAKRVQEMLYPLPSARYALETELRPAIARITARMAFLLVRLSGSRAQWVMERANADLEDVLRDKLAIERIAASIAAF